VDDDCDGTPDDGYVTTPTTCGQGECADNTGQLECQNGTEADTCDPFAGALLEGPFGDQTCNDGLDNDCDGLTDLEPGIEDPDCQDTGNCSNITVRNECRNTAGCEWVGGKNGMCVDVTGGQCTDNDGDDYGNPGDASCPNGAATDCDDNDATVNPGAIEGPPGDATCSDGKDNDCDGLTDEAEDPDCQIDCSMYSDKPSCNNDPNCKWRSQMCTTR
jgi:hypothetical protein